MKSLPDGADVYAVRTTGIYCRPGCPSRRPRRENVEFFRTPDDARRAGYRPCRRCLPDRPSGNLLAACTFIASHLDDAPTLDRIARHAGWSPFHLQRVFRRALGVSPKEYARRLRFERLGRELRSGRRVAPALYAAGFGSPSRVYERSSAQLGMSPAAVARKGAGMSIAYDIVDGPLGRTLIAATPLGICMVGFADSDADLVKDLGSRFPAAAIARSRSLLRFAGARLRRFLDGSVRESGLPLDVRGTAFQARVWESLRTIPRGETRTYAEVARAIGKPKAVRAVARACALNPVSLLVPCHRVIGTDGGLHGYYWGLERKQSLLALEKASAGASSRSAGRGRARSGPR
jgi:AraC family transcriptional regulator of adaptative response/methylated-DNA-[protein]-cysteine methyltransferase